MPPRTQSRDPSQPQLYKGDGGPLEAADFIATALIDLKRMSHRHRLDMLTYLLDLAYIEAQESMRTRRKSGQP
ncbi:MAG TPA: hypothetical protein VGC86_03780 [Afipia sp.]